MAQHVKTPARRVISAAPSAYFLSLAIAMLLSMHVVSSVDFLPPMAIRRHYGVDDASSDDSEPAEAVTIARRSIPIVMQREGRRLVWSDFLYPAKDPESPLNFELDPFNATAELTASQQDDIIYAAQHPTPKPTEKSTWTKFWQIFF